MTIWSVGGLSLTDGPFMIGAGVCKTPEATEEWLQVAPVVSGSYTPPLRSGNSGRVFYPETLEEFLRLGGGGNGFGMPNIGTDAAAKKFAARSRTRPLIASIAGFSVDDYLTGIVDLAQYDGIDANEINWGCPNTQGEHSDIISFNPVIARKILSTIAYNQLTTKPLWLKFSPYSNPAELKRMAELVNDFKDELRLTVVTCNTFPNAYFGRGKIDPNQGRGGLSGRALKYIALGQVHQFREYLDSSIDVIGVGGITTGDDIMDFLDAGAAAVQMTSLPFWAGNPKVFLEHLMDERTSSRFLAYLEKNS